MRNTLIRNMCICAVLIALMFVFSWTVLGMIPFTAAVSATTIFIPVAVGIILFDDFRYTVVLGLSFGLASWLRATLAPVGVLDPYFANPIISITPRLICALLTHVLYRVYRRIPNKVVKYGLTGATCALLNTIFTMLFLCTIYYNDITKIAIENGITLVYFVFFSVAVCNMLPEMAIGAVILIPVGKVTDVIVSKKEYQNTKEEIVEKDLKEENNDELQN